MGFTWSMNSWRSNNQDFLEHPVAKARHHWSHGIPAAGEGDLANWSSKGGRNPFVRLNPNDWDLIPWYHMFFSKQLLRLALTKWSPHFWRDLPNYRRCTNYSNPGQLYPPAPPKKNQSRFLLPRVETGGQKKSTPTAWHVTHTFFIYLWHLGTGVSVQSFPQGLNILSIYSMSRVLNMKLYHGIDGMVWQR